MAERLYQMFLLVINHATRTSSMYAAIACAYLAVGLYLIDKDTLSLLLAFLYFALAIKHWISVNLR